MQAVEQAWRADQFGRASPREVVNATNDGDLRVSRVARGRIPLMMLMHRTRQKNPVVAGTAKAEDRLWR